MEGRRKQSERKEAEIYLVFFLGGGRDRGGGHNQFGEINIMRVFRHATTSIQRTKDRKEGGN